MTIAFLISSLITLASAVAVMCYRNLVHCALALVLTFAGLASIYLELGAQFIGFAQILVYVGAVAILIVFAIMLTRGTEQAGEPRFARGLAPGVGVAALVSALLIAAAFSSKTLSAGTEAAPATSVQQLGHSLMTDYVLPLEVLGLLLTAALIGAVIIALNEPGQAQPAPSTPEAPSGNASLEQPLSP